MLDKQPKNLQALLIGSGQFSFADGATNVAAARAAGYIDFGNIVAFSLKSKGTVKEHIGSYNGVRRVDKTAVTEIRFGYQIKADESSAQNLRLALYGSLGANIVQTARVAAAADAIASPLAGRWYDLVIGGVRIREITTVASSAGVEDTDYVVDYKLGRIRAITATGFGTLTITAPAIVATDPTSLKTIAPNTTPIRRGMGRLICYDDDGILAFDHHDFYCELHSEGDPSFDGTKETEITVNINILNPAGTFAAAS